MTDRYSFMKERYLKRKKRVVFAFNKKQTPNKHMKYYLAINHAFGWIQDVGDRKGKEGLVS